jgi:putative PIN family toxin of toxin-antitoxin system
VKVVLDTNVLVSALWTQRGVCAQVIFSVVDYHTICLSDKVWDEYLAVLMRPKFDFLRGNLEKLFQELQAEASWVDSAPTAFKTKDPNDQIFLDLAVSAQADFLITGNIKDYPSSPKVPVQICSPAAYLRRTI